MEPARKHETEGNKPKQLGASVKARARNRRRTRPRAGSRKRLAAGAGLSLATAIAPAAAEATEFPVTTADDSAPGACDASCTLREAIAAANTAGTADRITFQASVSGDITLSLGEIDITDELTIEGPGAAALAIDGADANRLFNVQTSDPVSISGLTLKEGAGTRGGAIYSMGTNAEVAVTDSVLSGNEVTDRGGAIYTSSGDTTSVTIERSTLSGNTAGNDGGAFRGGGVTVRTSTLTANRADGSGGAIRSSFAPILIEDSTVSGNTADGAGGGVLGFTPTNVTIEDSTISGNTATTAGGGGLAVGKAPLTIRASTISGNMAPAAMYGGGGVYQRAYYAADSLAIENSTIAGNSTGGGGGGVRRITYGMGTPPPRGTITNSIVSDNSAPSSRDLFGAFNASFSLLESPAGSTVTETVAGSNITGQDPQLGPLAANGGPTRTRRPAPRSPAIDQGSTTATTDQRGKPRPFEIPGIPNSTAAGADGADIGAVELTAAESGLRCARRAATILAGAGRTGGTPGADAIVGTKGRNVIRGLGGNDRICGLRGKDRLFGGPGRDRLLGGPGRDRLLGGPGRDRLLGGPGRDRLLGGAGRDRLRGGPGADLQRQ